jgi:hypothetical protein
MDISSGASRCELWLATTMHGPLGTELSRRYRAAQYHPEDGTNEAELEGVKEREREPALQRPHEEMALR